MGVLVEYVKDVAASGKAALRRAKIIKQTGDIGFITRRERRRKSNRTKNVIVANSSCFLIGLAKLSLEGRLSKQIHHSDPRLKPSQLQDAGFF